MKQVFIIVFCILFACCGRADAQFLDTRKYIEVTGSAEMFIAPNEIELEIRLQEYSKDGRKIRLDEISREFYSTLRQHHIDTASLAFRSLHTSSTYWWYWWRHRNDEYQVRTVLIKLDSTTNILKLVEDLNKKWVQNVGIAKSSHTKIYEYRKQVKTEAARAAREKAKYLLESLGEELDGVLSVTEVPELNSWWDSGNLLSNISNSSYTPGKDEVQGGSISGAANIKLRYEIKVKFAIK